VAKFLKQRIVLEQKGDHYIVKELVGRMEPKVRKVLQESEVKELLVLAGYTNRRDLTIRII